MPWESVRAFSGAWPSRLVPCVPSVPCSKGDKRGSATWGLAPARITRHALTCECALERLSIRTVRHTIASHGMQHIDLCDAENMLVNNMAPELLLR